MLLTEFDETRTAVINPADVQDPVEGFPETVISVFSHVLFDRLVCLLAGKQIAEYHDVDGVWPVYAGEYNGLRLALVKARLGAPACVGSFEDVIALGAKRILLLGNCGVLDRRIADCGILIPTKALRDEGTSHHYAPPSDWIRVNRRHRALFKAMLRELGYAYVEGTTWTTDAFYRETPEKVQRRRDMGALCVEMECAAMQALCDFRGVDFFQFLYAGDNLDHPQWDPRSLSGHAKLTEKEKLAMLLPELACRIERAHSQSCPCCPETGGCHDF